MLMRFDKNQVSASSYEENDSYKPGTTDAKNHSVRKR